MAIEYNTNEYMSRKDILAFPDHYVAITKKIPKGDPLAKDVGGRKIIKAGTVYPANDNTAIGVIMNDYDVTNGDANVAVIIHGFIRTDKMPTAASAAAQGVLTQIAFLPITHPIA